MMLNQFSQPKPWLPFLLLLSGIVLIQCQTAKNGKSTAPDKLLSKAFPAENFFLQRAFPQKDFDYKAFGKSLSQLRDQVTVRTHFKGFDQEWTTQGPGNIGARVNSIAVHPQDDAVMFAGFAHGGVFKTTDGGINWAPVFDDQAFLSIGDIEIDPLQPQTIYVGTGDVNIPAGFFIGDGIYKSEDGGQNWRNIGLKEHGIISKIVVNPANSRVIYAGAMGIPSILDSNRGLYKSDNEGNTWKKILDVGTDAGIVDIVINPLDTNILYASGWNRYRTNFESIVTGPSGGIWRSQDAGETWSRLTNGLPVDTSGRVGLTISPSHPDLLYAVFVGADNELRSIFKTNDGGDTWTEVANISNFEDADEENPLGGFGWYFGKIRVNPLDTNEIYLLGVDLWKSNDGGETWEMGTPPWWVYSVHADKHDLVFNNANHLILGTDGGIYRSQDSGATWEDIENIATTQFYRVAYNPHRPGDYFGGAQDNGTSGGNATAINDWERIYGGDGFQPQFHPTNPLVFYVETQNGNITGTRDGGASWFSADRGLGSDRKNWDMPYLISPHDPNVLYAGTYRIQKSTAGAQPNFQPLTIDLTSGIRNSRYNVSALDESRIRKGILYAGTSDGLVWRYEEDTQILNELSNGLPQRYVTSVKASPNVENWVYVTHSGYKYNEYIPRVHRSKSKGAVWEDISSDLPDLAVSEIFPIPGHADSILFVATDGGVYGTLNGGENWERLGTNMPIVPVFDLEYNPSRNELIAGTYARSIMTYPLDAIFETVSVEPVETEPKSNITTLKIFPNPAAEKLTLEYYNQEAGRETEIAIVDQQGRLVKFFTERKSGRNRFRIDVNDLPKGLYFVKVKTRHVIRSASFEKI